MEKDNAKNSIKTIPHGSYEAGLINEENRKKKKTSLNDITTDLQGNGYPVGPQEKKREQ